MELEHSCSWCQQVLLDFSANTTRYTPSGPGGRQFIAIPMPFEGCTISGIEGRELIKCINEFLLLSAAAGCLFSSTVIEGLGIPHGHKPVNALFSWIGGIEFIGVSSSFCLTNYYWKSKISPIWSLVKGKSGELTGKKESTRPGSLFLDSNTYRIPSNTLRCVKDWLSECEASHPECQRRYETHFIPKRLLQIDHVGAKWRVQLKYPIEPCTYSALSYCWGGAQDVMFTTSNQALWETSGLPWDELPRTIQDALLVAFGLGIAFVWIDSLCILQDNDADKGIQIAQMPQIYNSAIVTISALGAASVYDGLFKPIRLPLSHAKSVFELPAHGGPDSCDSAIFVPSHQIRVTSLEEDNGVEPLDQRGWTFQEALLSRRQLKFSRSTMRWECQNKLEREFDEGKRERLLDCFPLNPSVRRMRHHANFSYILRSGQLYCPGGRKSGRPESGFNQPDIYPWHKLVEEYSRRSLSLPEDRALAISGIAERIGHKTGDQYCAGLWRSCLANQLAWYDDNKLEAVESSFRPISIRILSSESNPGPLVFQSGGAFSLPIGNPHEQRRQLGGSIVRQPEKKTKELKCPSWSWISIQKPIRFRVLGVCFTLEITDVQVQPSLEAAQFGHVDFGVLTVRGPIKPATIYVDAGIDSKSSEPRGSLSDSFLWLKIGEDESVENDSSQKAICLKLQKNTEYTWVRIGISETSNTGWLETRTIVII